MVLVRILFVELGTAVILLSSYSEAVESCEGAGESCKEGGPAGCTRRTLCDNITEIDLGDDETGCRQCQKPCSESIYVMYSSREDVTPASGWYTYKKLIKSFVRNLKHISTVFDLNKDSGNWTLDELTGEPSYRKITDRIELTYYNDERTRIALHNFGIDENELRSWTIYTEPNETSVKYGAPYEEKLVVFCPEKCSCKKIEVKSIYNFCFNGVYKRVDKTQVNKTQETSADNQIRKKRSYFSKSKAKRSHADFPNNIFKGFPGFIAHPIQSDSSNHHSPKYQANNEPAFETTSIGEQNQNWQQDTHMPIDYSQKNHINNELQDIFFRFSGFIANPIQSDSPNLHSTTSQPNSKPASETTYNYGSIANSIQSDSPNHSSTISQTSGESTSETPDDYGSVANSILSDSPNHFSTISQTSSESASENPDDYEQNQNWQQEYYKSTSGDPNDDPFEFTYDEDYQVWFIGKRDMISAVIPEASPCPEMIQKQPWLLIQNDEKLRIGNFNITINCLQRG